MDLVDLHIILNYLNKEENEEDDEKRGRFREREKEL